MHVRVCELLSNLKVPSAPFAFAFDPSTRPRMHAKLMYSAQSSGHFLGAVVQVQPGCNPSPPPPGVVWPAQISSPSPATSPGSLKSCLVHTCICTHARTRATCTQVHTGAGHPLLDISLLFSCTTPLLPRITATSHGQTISVRTTCWCMSSTRAAVVRHRDLASRIMEIYPYLGPKTLHN